MANEDESWNNNATLLILAILHNVAEATLALEWFLSALEKSGWPRNDDQSPPPNAPDEPFGNYFHAIVHAKTFLYSLDSTLKIANTLAKLPKVPNPVIEARNKLREHFPDVPGLRNSLLHIEDRIRGLVRNKKMDLEAAGGLTFHFLIGKQFASTIEGDRLGELEVSERSLIVVVEYVENVLNAFDWKGAPHKWSKWA